MFVASKANHPPVELPGVTRYGMSSWMHEGRQYIIVQLPQGIAAMALPVERSAASDRH